MAESNDEININVNDNNKEEKINPSRYPKCYLIPLITMHEEENKLKLQFKCSNNHEYNEEYNNLYNKSKIDMDNIISNKCNIKKLKNKFYLCSQCNKFYCKSCKSEQKKENNHLLIMIQDVKFIIKI